MTNIALVIGVVAAILTIIGFFIPIKAAWARFWHAAYILVVALIIGFATYQSSRLSRLDDIANSADRLVADRRMNFTNRGYVMAVLSFLEKNKDLYPDTYARAVETCRTFKCDDPTASVDMIDLASTFDGIVIGMGRISKNR